jgi:hypothetical protein
MLNATGKYRVIYLHELIILVHAVVYLPPLSVDIRSN